MFMNSFQIIYIYIKQTKYITKHISGKGAYGCVKMAYRRSDRLLCVAKFIVKEKVGALFWSDAPDGRRVPLELSLLMTLDHTNIVSLLKLLNLGPFLYSDCFKI